jgi:sensor histidine kinase YesM
MIEWTLIIIMTVTLVALVHLLRNLIRTLNNIYERLYGLSLLVNEYAEHLMQINESETYYGDPTIEAFVKISNEINDNLKTVLDLQNELAGGLDAEKTHKA